MTNKLSIVTITLLTLLTSCNYYRLYKDSKIAGEILAEVGATGGKIYYSTEQLGKDKTGSHFVELNVVDAEMLRHRPDEEAELSSFCAVELYKRLDPKTIDKNSGVNIFFNGQRNLLNYKTHYFEMEELKRATQAFHNIDNYITSISLNDFNKSYSCFDSSVYNLLTIDMDSLSSLVNSKTGNSILKTHYFFGRFILESKSGKRPTSCFTISAFYTLQSTKQVRIDFLTDAYNDNKILAIDTRIYDDQATN